VVSVQAKINSYRDLLVWQKGMELVKVIYSVSRTFPGDEKFGLTSQLRRSCISVPSNIAEGQARKSTQEFIHFLSIAKGSLAEVDTQVLLAFEFNYLNQDEYDEIANHIDELQRMLFRLMEKLEKG
jgi:four helix bundle protein